MMELTVANIISSLLVYGVKIFVTDSVSFFSRVHIFLHDFPNIFTTKWNIEMQKSNSSVQRCRGRCVDEIEKGMGVGVGVGEINLMLNGVGIGLGGLDDCENKSNLDEEDLVGLFDEEEPSFDEIKEAFKVFDVNEDGFIDGAELQRVVCSLGLKEGCSLDECKRMIRHFDANGDGLIDFQEFLKFMEICLSAQP